MTDIDKLERLNALREKGALSEQEYQQQKARLLAPQSFAQSSRAWRIAIALGVVLIVGLAIAFRTPKKTVERVPSPAVLPDPSPSVVPDVEPAPPSVAPPKIVDPPVPKSAAPDPTNADYYNEAKRDMMQAYKDQPAGIRQLLGDYAGANTLCRGSSDAATIDKWCPIRDALAQKLEKVGMCYGRPTDKSAAESDWHTCDERDRQ